MLSLDSNRWSELEHAYGKADDIPELLEQLYKLPSSANDAEPWFTIWSALAHQGDVYSASFAAVPHVINALASDPPKADFSYFGFPAWVEICRVKNQVQIPEDLQVAYFKSLENLPTLVGAASSKSWDFNFLSSALAAIAIAKGQPTLAEILFEISDPREAEQILQRLIDR